MGTRQRIDVTRTLCGAAASAKQARRPAPGTRQPGDLTRMLSRAALRSAIRHRTRLRQRARLHCVTATCKLRAAVGGARKQRTAHLCPRHRRRTAAALNTTWPMPGGRLRSNSASAKRGAGFKRSSSVAGRLHGAAPDGVLASPLMRRSRGDIAITVPCDGGEVPPSRGLGNPHGHMGFVWIVSKRATHAWVRLAAMHAWERAVPRQGAGHARGRCKGTALVG